MRLTGLARRAASVVALGLMAGGCGTLDIENPNAPDAERALASGQDVINLVGGSFSNWYYSTQNYSPAVASNTVALTGSMSWGNWGSRRYSSVPRVAFVNSATDQQDIRQINEIPWYNNYAALSSVNVALKQLADPNALADLSASDRDMLKAAATFIQGAALANIGMFFNQGFVLDENTDVSTLEFEPASAVRDAAVNKLDAAITLATGKSFKLPNSFLNVDGWTAAQLAQVANTMAARALAYHPRNRAEVAQVNWARVQAYAEKGITFDPAIVGDGNNWFDPYKACVNAWDTWHRVNQRVVKEMDNAAPYPYPASGAPETITPPNTADQRYDPTPRDADYVGQPGKDFVYVPYVVFNPARGRYHFSNVGSNRYGSHSFEDPSGGGLGRASFMLAAENDLLLAEALIRQGTAGRARAATLINKTRVGRGGLPALTGSETSAAGIPGLAFLNGTDNNDVLLRALFYERDVELWGSSGNTPLYDARRTDRFDNPPVPGAPNAGILAAGDLTLSYRQLPVPAKELQVLGEEIYTFAGKDSVKAAPSINGELPRVVRNYVEIGGKKVTGPGAVLTIANLYNDEMKKFLRSKRRF